MKNLKNVQGAKALSVNEQKEVFGGGRTIAGVHIVNYFDNPECRNHSDCDDGFGGYFCCHNSHCIDRPADIIANNNESECGME